MYDNDPEDSIPQNQPQKKLSKQQESKLRGMIDDDQFLYSQIDQAYGRNEEEDVGNRYAAEPRVKAEIDSDEDAGNYKMPTMRPYDNDMGAMRMLNQLQNPKDQNKDHSDEIEDLMYKGLT